MAALSPIALSRTASTAVQQSWSFRLYDGARSPFHTVPDRYNGDGYCSGRGHRFSTRELNGVRDRGGGAGRASVAASGERRRSHGNRSRRPPRVLPRRQQQRKNGNDTEESPLIAGNRLFPVSAIHVGQTIDLFSVISKLFARGVIKRHMFNKTSFVVELQPQTSRISANAVGGNTAANNGDLQYVAVYRYGSIVAFNLSPRYVAELVADIKKTHSTDPILDGFERKENYGVMVQPPRPPSPQQRYQSTAVTSEGCGEERPPPEGEYIPGQQDSITQVTGDYCIVPDIDLNGVSVIGNIMAQTVALDSYNDNVDELLARFAQINADVAKTGQFSSTDKDFLFKTVAQNNVMFVDMIGKIRIKDRSDTAWNLTKYEKIHYEMKEEFEIDERFSQIEFKLNLIQQNAKFFVEVMQSQKSNTLEWLIVWLIAVECGIMCVDMSGMGEAVTAPILEFFSLVVPPK